MVGSITKPTASRLKEIALFRSLTESELNQIIRLGSAVQYEPHTNVVIEGELSWGLYMILEGMVGIFKTNKLTGNTYDIGQLQSGSFFGEMSLIDDNPRSATVRTLTPCSLFYLSKDTFLQYLDQSEDLKLRFAMNCISTLVKRLRDLDDYYVVSQYQLWESALRKDPLR